MNAAKQMGLLIANFIIGINVLFLFRIQPPLIFSFYLRRIAKALYYLLQFIGQQIADYFVIYAFNGITLI